MRSNYKEVEDFMLDPQFKSWVLHPQPESDEFWGKWLNNNPAQKDKFLLAKELIQHAEFKEFTASSEVSERVLDNILTREGTRSINSANNKKFIISWWGISRFAAVLVLAVGLYLIYSEYTVFNSDNGSSVTSVVKNNPPGRKSQVFLPDGSIVWLNSASSIEYLPEFSENNRVVELKGEAYFDVAKNASKPFIVISKDLSVTALGTAFNVRSFVEDESMEVALIEGKVKVENVSLTRNTPTEYLEPGQFVEYNSKEKVMRKGVVDMKAKIAWKSGIIDFERASFNEVVRTIERWYGVKIQVVNENKTEEWQYSSQFDNESLENVLKSLSYTKQFKYDLNKNLVTIKF
ncbi:FecR domain-containing protein [Reichenbachiella sp. MALMAid0571]|uniref:FecR family protein n=1 Tax=Reichenbachiella sp. MALMAid0571 TaxID=3143939 RepID=UPI0032DE8220